MKTNNRKYIIIFLVLFSSIWGCEEFIRRKIGGFAGSYPFVEYWNINATETEVIEAIVELKKENPSLQPPNEKELYFPRKVDYDWGSDEMKDHLHRSLALKDSTLPLPPMTKSNTISDHWLYIHFYYEDTKEVVHTFIQSPYGDTTTTHFAFISLKKTGSPPGESKLINRDFWYIANKCEIRKFKSTFVDKIQAKIDKKRKV
ncbi:hypothetical protein BH09BAC1_BH09BAC1_28380 [soil metagenome]